MENYKKGPSQQKHEFKNVFICGGTGFLGYYSAKEFLRQGANVGVLALPNELTLSADWWPKRSTCITADSLISNLATRPLR